jgi:hypothetical protein
LTNARRTDLYVRLRGIYPASLISFLICKRNKAGASAAATHSPPFSFDNGCFFCWASLRSAPTYEVAERIRISSRLAEHLMQLKSWSWAAFGKNPGEENTGRPGM